MNGPPALPQDLLCNIRDMFCGLDLSRITLRLYNEITGFDTDPSQP
jgi:hypothetical protein